LGPAELTARIKSARKKVRQCVLFGFLSLFAAVIVVVLLGPYEAIGPLVFFLAILFLILSLFFFLHRYSYRSIPGNLIKTNIVCELLAETFELESYLQNGCFTKEQINSSLLFDHCSECNGSDLVKGKYKGVPIEFCDITLKKQCRLSDDNYTIVTVFKGQWLEIGLKKNLDSPVYLAERTGNALTGCVKMQEVKTDSDAFNKKYRVLAENQQTALYILTPHFMEYITAADNAADSATYFCFSGSRAIIAMGSRRNRRDLFEIDKPKKSMDWFRSKMKSDLRYITGVIDELLKNEYLFERG